MNNHRFRCKHENKPLEKKGAVKLGDALSLVTEKLIKQPNGFEDVLEVWKQCVPETLAEHCRIDEFKNQRLVVKADSPPYANEMRWLSDELLTELAARSPQTNVREIRVVIG